MTEFTSANIKGEILFQIQKYMGSFQLSAHGYLVPFEVPWDVCDIYQGISIMGDSCHPRAAGGQARYCKVSQMALLIYVWATPHHYSRRWETGSLNKDLCSPERCLVTMGMFHLLQLWYLLPFEVLPGILNKHVYHLAKMT